MVGPTRVQAEWCVPSLLFFISSGVRVILCNKRNLSVPLASRGSLVRDGVSKKLDAGRAIEKGLRAPHGM